MIKGQNLSNYRSKISAFYYLSTTPEFKKKT